MSELKVNCPTCQKEVLWNDSSSYRPFCSKRCQLIDLGEWANENHVIEGKPGFTDVDLSMDEEEVEALLQQQDKGFFNND